MLYLDLAELDGGVPRAAWLWSTQSPCTRRASGGTISFGDPALPLDVCVRDARRGRARASRPEGPGPACSRTRAMRGIRDSNPLSVSTTAFDARGRDASTRWWARCTSTPWGERHCYVLPAHAAKAPPPSGSSTPKELPRLALHGAWRSSATDWRGRGAGRRISGLCASRTASSWRRAHLRCTRSGWSWSGGSSPPAALARAPRRASPLLTAQIAAGIYWQALRFVSASARPLPPASPTIAAMHWSRAR